MCHTRYPLIYHVVSHTQASIGFFFFVETPLVSPSFALLWPTKCTLRQSLTISFVCATFPKTLPFYLAHNVLHFVGLRPAPTQTFWHSVQHSVFFAGEVKGGPNARERRRNPRKRFTLAYLQQASFCRLNYIFNTQIRESKKLWFPRHTTGHSINWGLSPLCIFTSDTKPKPWMSADIIL